MTDPDAHRPLDPHAAPGRLERRKDTLQVVVESGATHLGNVFGIVAGAVRDVSRELGDWATDVFEMREAARRAQASADDGADPDGGDAG